MTGDRPFKVSVSTLIFGLLGALGCKPSPFPVADPEIQSTTDPRRSRATLSKAVVRASFHLPTKESQDPG
jgi:hypothetical protein